MPPLPDGSGPPARAPRPPLFLRGLALLLGLAVWVALLEGGDAGPVRAAGEDPTPPELPAPSEPAAPAPEPSASETLRPALEAALRHLRDVPGAAALDPERHPPVVEGMRAGPRRARLRWRQELEMEYGTLVALYRGIVDLGRERASDPWRVVGEGVASGPPPPGLPRLPERASRTVHRALERPAPGRAADGRAAATPR